MVSNTAVSLAESGRVTGGAGLKQRLQRAERRRRIRAVLLVVPLFLFLALTFVLPIATLLLKSVYDPELAHCCSCEPQREAAIQIRLEKQKAEALKACLELQQLELELKRRQMLLDNGELGPFTPSPAPEPL